MTIQTTNNFTLNAPKTYLSFSEVAGTGVLRWKNPNGFNASWAIQIGETGEEQSEVLVLGTGTPAGTAGTLLSNTLYPHSADTPIYGIKYDQVVFERSLTGTAGTASPMTGGTKTIQSDRNVTEFDDTSGSSSYAYRTYLRNSITNETTIESDWITSGGFEFYSLAKMRSRIKAKLWNADFIKDDDLNDWINECKDIMVNKAIQTNEGYSMGTVNVAFGTDGLGTVTTTDFSQIRRLWVTYDGNNKYASTKMDINDFIPDQTFSSVHPFHAWRGDNVFIVQPSSSPGTAEIVYYQFGTTMVNDVDTLPLPIRPFTNIFVDYAKAQALSKDQKESESQVIMGRVNAQMEEFVTSLAPRDKSSQTMVDLVEPIDGEDWIY